MANAEKAILETIKRKKLGYFGRVIGGRKYAGRSAGTTAALEEPAEGST